MKAIYFPSLLLFCLFSIFTSTAQTKQTDNYGTIMRMFDQWKQEQFIKGNFASEKNCDPEIVTKPGYKGSLMGIPRDVNVYFTDINLDDKLDAVIVFYPDQCDGGNALMNVQIKLVVLSGSNGYSVDDHTLKNIESKLNNGWLIVESSAFGNVYGTYYEYKPDDGKCCPSITRPFSIEFKTKKFEFSK